MRARQLSRSGNLHSEDSNLKALGSRIFAGMVCIGVLCFAIYQISKAKLSNEAVLCVEVGHTRIKSALLPKDPTLEDLKKIKTFSCLSKPWLNKNVEQLFKKSKQNPLNKALAAKPSEISLSIFGPVYDKKIHGGGEKSGVSSNLQEILQKVAPTKIRVEADSVSWAIGALEFLKLQSQAIQYPCLAITFGTGPGVALIEDPHTVSAIEVWIMDLPFTRLKPLAEPYGKSDHPYGMFLKKFLDELAGGEKNLDEKMRTYRGEFNRQIEAFAEDVCESVQSLFPSLHKIQTILVGGGLSRFIDLKIRSAIIFNPQFLEQLGVSPDIIQLLGCHRMCREDPIVTKTYPSHKELNAALEARKRRLEKKREKERTDKLNSMERLPGSSHQPLL